MEQLHVNQAVELIDPLIGLSGNLANLSAFLYDLLPGLNWAGFYLMKDGGLILGPFQGKIACTRIAVGKGVCGTSVLKQETIVVPDVHLFPGHIACDSASESEIVVPIIKDGEVLGVLDIDAPTKNRFSQAEKKFLEAFVKEAVLKCFE
ncbi:MAG: GAF domain-containing protein [Erysipelotrichaceae bacterium]|jgi:GAF domain-containing protein|nr:GAF domain-containing protein [Erysipelotrichaceae bacterium]